MSSQYNVEPLPTGRVLIKTSMGPIDIELFAKETPQTCRSFIQLCLEGYYNNVVFHRIVKDFIIQTGDPTGTGTGGEAATPDGILKDEFNQRLKYTRRGLLGMANSGEKDDNGSQFFITLSATPELERRNTLFGRVAVGDTIFNVLRIGDLETDKLDRPVHPPRVISIEVIENPFKDIVPRSTEAERLERQRKLEEEKVKAVVKKAKKRNKALLSFGDEEPENVQIKTKIKSVYDLDGSQPAPEPFQPKNPNPIEPPKTIKAIKAPVPETIDLTTSAPTTSFSAAVPIIVDDNPPSPPPAPKNPQPKISVEDQIASLKSELKNLKNRPAETSSQQSSSKRPKTFLEDEISRYMSSGRAIKGKRPRTSRREDDTLSKLTAFQKKIIGAPTETPTAEIADVESEPCELHNVPGCMSCFDRFGELPDDDDPKSLWGHQLVFAKDVFGKDEKFRVQRQGEDLEVIDPREREKEFAVLEKKRGGGGGVGGQRGTKVWRQDDGKRWEKSRP